MAVKKQRPEAGFETPPEVFDRAHLAHYTMNAAELEREIVGLFLMQLPATLEMIESAETAAEWKLATHTLKGAAASIGAKRLQLLAVGLEAMPIHVDVNVKAMRLRALRAAAAEFRQTVQVIYR